LPKTEPKPTTNSPTNPATPPHTANSPNPQANGESDPSDTSRISALIFTQYQDDETRLVGARKPWIGLHQ
jgi:hypothetical protein